MESFMRKASNGFEQRYFGRVIDNFTCDDPIMQQSLPNIMGEYLFYHIVDSPETATQIMSSLNAGDFPGEFNFFVLDIIDRCDFDKHDMVSRVSFDAKFQKIFEKICCSLPPKVVDLENVSNDPLSQVTSDSSFIERNGVLISMNIDTHINSIELYQQQKELVDMDEATQYELSETSYRMISTIEQINETSGLLKQQHQTMSHLQKMQCAIAQTTQAINLCERHIQIKKADLQKHEAKVNELTESKDCYENEMKLSLLTEQESQSIESIQNEIIAKNVQLHLVASEMNDLKKRREFISDYFENSLMSRYSVLAEHSMIHSNNASELNLRKEELVQSKERQRQTDANLIENQNELMRLRGKHLEKKLILRELEQQKIKIEGMQPLLFAELNKMNAQQQNCIAVLHRLRAQKPYDATQIHNPDIVDMSEEEVNNHLNIARHQLKTYDNSNSFDMNVLKTFSNDRENFMRRRVELSQLESKIRLVMKKIEASMETSFQKTFHDLAKRFSKIFVRFVSNGSATLHLIKEENGQIGSVVPTGNEIVKSKMQEAVGLNIMARFGETAESFDSLFGSERRLVALVFIISMQQLCITPFYLFDCVDEVVILNCHIKTYLDMSFQFRSYFS